jgi:hypothetical protein
MCAASLDTQTPEIPTGKLLHMGLRYVQVLVQHRRCGESVNIFCVQLAIRSLIVCVRRNVTMGLNNFTHILLRDVASALHCCLTA